MLSLNDTQLVVLDIQGKLSQIVYESENVIAQSKKLIEGCRLLEIPVLWVEQTPDKLGETTPAVAQALARLTPIAKSSFSAYGQEHFVAQLKKNQRKQVLIIGIETHICIYQTTVDLLSAGYEVYVVADAVSSRTLANKNIGLQMISQAQGKLTCVEGALFSLLKTSQHEKFRDIAKLIK